MMKSEPADQGWAAWCGTTNRPNSFYQPTMLNQGHAFSRWQLRSQVRCCDIIHRSLVSAKLPSRLQSSGLLCSDGKRPDGMTIIPWSIGWLLVWDATCCDTLATSNVHTTVSEAGAVAARVEDLMIKKYEHLDFAFPSSGGDMWGIWLNVKGVFEGPGTAGKQGNFRWWCLLAVDTKDLSCNTTWQHCLSFGIITYNSWLQDTVLISLTSIIIFA